MVSVPLEFKVGRIQIFSLQEKLDNTSGVGRKRGRGREGEEREKERELENYARLFVFEWILRGWHANQQGIIAGMLFTVAHQV